MDFTHTSYKQMLHALATAGYTFSRFPQAPTNMAAATPFVLLRHDMDLDLEAALAMAHIEAEMGIASTYFVMVRTQFYNVFSQAGSHYVRTILGLGHDIGLHFDCAAYPSDADTDFLAAACRQETHLLESWFGNKVETVSIHRPQPNVLAGDPALTAPLPHTYMDFYTKTIHYVADSRGGWHYGHPLEQPAFQERRPMQILVHPIWWRDEVAPPLQTLHDFEDRRAAELMKNMAANSTIYRPRPLVQAVPALLQPEMNGQRPPEIAIRNGKAAPVTFPTLHVPTTTGSLS
ncbi:MAG: hypothetical protein KBG20_14140 [Caldilineaceae bacterium]|nr:hypothetical protein [Caldilineaceae bacterium]MBP8106730.1 hypothetical protein [Caldilineaceae bacterium]MBP8123399.1 hypothetical protein [Caldilineaceae bacterium]MBP9073442.1 hypothetical protein [Caldilineaceae bacterium]